MSKFISFALIILCGVAPATAQAPRITPDGDPSVNTDTIYALALQPSEYGDRDQAFLLDDGVVTVEQDGTGTTTYRTVVQLLTRAAVEEAGEMSFSYDAVDEDFQLNWVHVVDPSGRVISDAPRLHQVLDAPVADVSPVYTDRKQVRLSLAGLEPGTIVDYSTTRTTKQASRTGDFRAFWLISMASGVRRSRYIVDVPADYDLTIKDAPHTMDPVVTTQGGRRTYVWSAADLPRIEGESFEVRYEREGYQELLLGGPSEWADVGAWYAGLARDRYELTPEVLTAAQEEVGTNTGLAALRALHRWIAQDFRYVSISLGAGGYQPRFPSDVLATRSGDCKDKATIFIALARHYGFEAFPVLLHSSAGVEEEIVSIREFNHAIAAVRHEGEWIYLDLTADIIPFGEVPGGYQGEFGLIVFDDGEVEEVTFPLDPPEANALYQTVEGMLDATGRFEGTVSTRSTGTVAHELRANIPTELTSEQLEQFGQGAASIIENGTGTDARVFSGLDLESEVSMSVRITSPRATRQNVGGGQIFILPIDSHANPGLVAELEGELATPRATPINVDAVSGPVAVVSELRLTLPDGWTAELPEDVSARSRFGSYEATYAQEGNLVTVARRFTGSTGTAPKETFPELVEWLRDIATDEALFLLLQPATP